jgi:hypothetical protein
MKKKKWLKYLHNERGMADILVTLIIMPILLFLCFAIVPFFVYTMKMDHLNTIANHALKEAEAVGYMSPTVIANTNDRLTKLGLGATTISGVEYPSYSGSTSVKTFRDSADPTIKLVIKYPATNLTKMLGALGGNSSGSANEGFFNIVLYGKSEAYE